MFQLEQKKNIDNPTTTLIIIKMSEWKSMEDAPLDREIEAINADGVIKMIRWYAMNRYRSCWCCDIAEDGLSFRAFIPVGWRK